MSEYKGPLTSPRYKHEHGFLFRQKQASIPSINTKFMISFLNFLLQPEHPSSGPKPGAAHRTKRDILPQPRKGPPGAVPVVARDVTVEHGSCTALLTGSWICGLSAVPIPMAAVGTGFMTLISLSKAQIPSLGAVTLLPCMPPTSLQALC